MKNTFKKSLLATFLSAALLTTGAAQANLFNDFGNWVEGAAEDTGEWVEGAANDTADFFEGTAIDAGNTIENTANDIGQFSEQTFNDGVDAIEQGVKDAGDAIAGVATDVYEAAADAMFQQMKDPMVGMADAWKTLVASEPAKYSALEKAIQDNDGPAIKDTVLDVLVSLYTYAGFAGIVQDFKDENAGSLMLIVSAGGGAGVTAEVDVGIALDIDYLIDLGNVVVNGSKSAFDGAIASLFVAGGLQIGPAAGGGADFVVGYHTSNPDGVYGPGMDISLEVKAAVGGSVGMSYDISQAPWQIVMGGIGIGAGAEVKAAVGPSYATVLGQICADGSVKEFASECKGKTDDSVSEAVSKNSTNSIVGIETDVDENWKGMGFNSNTFRPSVFLSAPTFNGLDGGVMRIKDVSNSGFSMRFQEWDYLDGDHMVEQVDHIVFPEGAITSIDDSSWQVGSFYLKGTKVAKTIQFDKAFDSVPYVFLTIQTANGESAVIARVRNVTKTGFEAALFEQESLNGTGHEREKVSFLAVAPTNGAGGGVYGYELNMLGFSYVFNTPFTVYSAEVDHSGTRVGSHTYYLQEDQSADDELAHTPETINVLEISGVTLVQQVTSRGADTTSIRRQ